MDNKKNNKIKQQGSEMILTAHECAHVHLTPLRFPFKGAAEYYSAQYQLYFCGSGGAVCSMRQCRRRREVLEVSLCQKLVTFNQKLTIESWEIQYQLFDSFKGNHHSYTLKSLQVLGSMMKKAVQSLSWLQRTQNVITTWLGCIVGNVGTRFGIAVQWSSTTLLSLLDSLGTRILLPFQNLHYPQCNLSTE